MICHLSLSDIAGEDVDLSDQLDPTVVAGLLKLHLSMCFKTFICHEPWDYKGLVVKVYDTDIGRPLVAACRKLEGCESTCEPGLTLILSFILGMHRWILMQSQAFCEIAVSDASDRLGTVIHADQIVCLVFFSVFLALLVRSLLTVHRQGSRRDCGNEPHSFCNAQGHRARSSNGSHAYMCRANSAGC